MAARSKARKRALDILFASELRSEDPVMALERAIEAGEGPTNDYTATLVRGVVEKARAMAPSFRTDAAGHAARMLLEAANGDPPRGRRP